jgi:hypothetical protein
MEDFDTSNLFEEAEWVFTLYSVLKSLDSLKILIPLLFIETGQCRRALKRYAVPAGTQKIQQCRRALKTLRSVGGHSKHYAVPRSGHFTKKMQP